MGGVAASPPLLFSRKHREGFFRAEPLDKLHRAKLHIEPSYIEPSYIEPSYIVT